MARRFLWIPVAALLAVSTFTSPFSGGGVADAGPGTKPVAACKDELGTTREALLDAQAEVARLRTEQRMLQAQVDKLSTAERQRQQRLQAQLGAPIAERLR